MAACPVCQSAIEILAQHHGTLYTCPRCNAVFFVDWSGQPEFTPLEEEASPAADPYPVEPVPLPDYGPTSELTYDQNQSFGSPTQDFQQFNANPTEAPYGLPQETSQEPMIPDGQSFDPVPANFGEPVSEEPYGSVAPDYGQPMASDSNPFAEVTDFANSETSTAAFNYTLSISGIDSAQVRASIQEAMSESKFGWDVPELLAQIKDGTLTIRSVSAVKASILVQRIKYLPVKISWSQDVLSSTV